MILVACTDAHVYIYIYIYNTYICVHMYIYIYVHHGTNKTFPPTSVDLRRHGLRGARTTVQGAMQMHGMYSQP